MDLRRLSPGERIAAVSGIALFVSLFLDWLEELTAWELFAVVDVLFTVLALSAVAAAGARGAGINLPRWPLVQVGVVALAITLAVLVEGAERGAGIWLCAIAAAGILYGGAILPRRDAHRDGDSGRGARWPRSDGPRRPRNARPARP
nr:hypothetical protein [Thermoleophilaceae bacterium]